MTWSVWGKVKISVEDEVTVNAKLTIAELGLPTLLTTMLTSSCRPLAPVIMSMFPAQVAVRAVEGVPKIEAVVLGQKVQAEGKVRLTLGRSTAESNSICQVYAVTTLMTRETGDTECSTFVENAQDARASSSTSTFMILLIGLADMDYYSNNPMKSIQLLNVSVRRTVCLLSYQSSNFMPGTPFNQANQIQFYKQLAIQPLRLSPFSLSRLVAFMPSPPSHALPTSTQAQTALQTPNTPTPQYRTSPTPITSPLDKLKSIKEKNSETDKNEEKVSSEIEEQRHRQNRRQSQDRGRLSRSRDKKKHRRLPKKKHIKSQLNSQNPNEDSERKHSVDDQQATRKWKQKQYDDLVKQLLGQSGQSQEKKNLPEDNQKQRFCLEMKIPKDQTWDSILPEPLTDNTEQNSSENAPPKAIYAGNENPLSTNLPTTASNHTVAYENQSYLLPQADSGPTFGEPEKNSYQFQHQYRFPLSFVTNCPQQSPYYYQSVSKYPQPEADQGKQDRPPILGQQNNSEAPSQQGLRNCRGHAMISEREKYYKTRLCFDFKMGRCSKSKTQCNFAHGQDDLRRPKSNNLCRNFQRGYCKKSGSDCKFVHALSKTQDEGNGWSQENLRAQGPSGGDQKRGEGSTVRNEKQQVDKLGSGYFAWHCGGNSQNPQQAGSQERYSYGSTTGNQFVNFAANTQRQQAYHYQNYAFYSPYYPHHYGRHFYPQSMQQYQPYLHLQYTNPSYYPSSSYPQDMTSSTPTSDSNHTHPYPQYPLPANFNFKSGGYTEDRHKRPAQECQDTAESALERRSGPRRQ